MSRSGPDARSPRTIAFLSIGAGVLAVAAATLADAFGFGGAAGMGSRQLTILSAGILALVVGIVLAGGGREAALRAWWTREIAEAPRLTAGTIVAFATVLGVATGFVEVVHQLTRQHVFDTMLKMPRDKVWMAPTSYIVIFAAAGAVLAGAAAMLRRLFTCPVVVGLLIALAVWTQLRWHPMADAVRAFVCFAVALQVARKATGSAEGFARRARRLLPWSIVALLALIGGYQGYRAADEARWMSNLPEPKADAPNVLFIVLDTVVADHLKLYGYERDTSPTIDRLGEEGVVFDQFISTAPWTLPAHSTMFTGAYGTQISVEWLKRLDNSHTTIGEVLSDHGYATAGFVGNLVYCLEEQGVGRGFAHYEDFQVGLPTFVMSSSLGRWAANKMMGDLVAQLARNDAPVVTERFLDWVDDNTERPFFAFLNYFDAHAPYRPPGKYREYFGPSMQLHLDRFGRRTWTPEEIQSFVNEYDGGIRYVDEHVRQVLEHLDAAGRLDNTLVVITGDHGEQFFEHGLMDHGNSLYMPLLHVPMIFHFPGRLAPQRVGEWASLSDLPQTILDLLGVETDAVLGHSLRHHWDPSAQKPATPAPILSEVQGGVRTPKWEPVSRGKMSSLIENGFSLIRNGDGIEELYDLNTDWEQLDDLVKKRPQLKQTLSRRLDQILESLR